MNFEKHKLASVNLIPRFAPFPTSMVDIGIELFSRIIPYCNAELHEQAIKTLTGVVAAYREKDREREKDRVELLQKTAALVNIILALVGVFRRQAQITVLSRKDGSTGLSFSEANVAAMFDILHVGYLWIKAFDNAKIRR